MKSEVTDKHIGAATNNYYFTNGRQLQDHDKKKAKMSHAW